MEELLNLVPGLMSTNTNQNCCSLGVTGVPAFFLRCGGSERYALSGAQPLEVFEEVFDRVLTEGRQWGGGVSTRARQPPVGAG